MLADIKIEIKKEGRLIISLLQGGSHKIALGIMHIQFQCQKEVKVRSDVLNVVSPLIASRSWTTTIEVNMGYSPIFFLQTRLIRIHDQLNLKPKNTDRERKHFSKSKIFVILGF